MCGEWRIHEELIFHCHGLGSTLNSEGKEVFVSGTTISPSQNGSGHTATYDSIESASQHDIEYAIEMAKQQKDLGYVDKRALLGALVEHGNAELIFDCLVHVRSFTEGDVLKCVPYVLASENIELIYYFSRRVSKISRSAQDMILRHLDVLKNPYWLYMCARDIPWLSNYQRSDLVERIIDTGDFDCLVRAARDVPRLRSQVRDHIYAAIKKCRLAGYIEEFLLGTSWLSEHQSAQLIKAMF